MFKPFKMNHLLIVALAMMSTNWVQADDNVKIFDLKMNSLAGKEVELSKYKGKVLLITNTASFCGATPQYEPLQKLHEEYADQGLVVLGFPCNQFGEQEPGSSEEITQFCKKNYGVTFDLFEKIDVNGKKRAPLFKYLTSYEKDPGNVKWNFEKFLVNKNGEVVNRFRTGTEPDSEEVLSAIKAELEK